MQPVLSFRGMTKRFGGTLAADGIDLDVFPGEILALLGQNGAGKSTLIKMLAGIVTPDSGSIALAGRPYDPRADRAVAFIHQDLGLIEWMTVAENIALAQGYRRRGGLIDWRGVERAAARSLSLIAHNIDPNQRVQDLTRTEKSLVAIARALGVDASILVLDEPTASLPQDEVEILFGVLRDLKTRGVAMIYVSHRLDEVYAIADRLAVLRDGRLVGDMPTADCDPQELVRMIIGRPPESLFVRPDAASGDVRLGFREVWIDDVGPLTFDLRAGEIVGLVGLRGAGQEAVGRALFGQAASVHGAVTLAGRPPDIVDPAAAIRSGISLVAGDRNADEIGPGLTVRENMFLNPGATGRPLWGWLTPGDEAAETARLGARVGLSPNDPSAPIETLSGGNQQKVVMTRWMRIGGAVLVLEDPTAGVDVGAKAEIYQLLAEAVRDGQAVLLVSTDFEEIAAICHRALVFRGGEIVAELAGGMTTEALVHAASLAAPRPAAA